MAWDSTPGDINRIIEQSEIIATLRAERDTAIAALAEANADANQLAEALVYVFKQVGDCRNIDLLLPENGPDELALANHERRLAGNGES